MAISSPLSPRISCANLSFYTRPVSLSKITKKSPSLATLAYSISQTFTSCPFSRAIRQNLTPPTLISKGNSSHPVNGLVLAVFANAMVILTRSQRPDLQLHGFGIKFHALQSPTVRQLLYSSDSMAWSFAGRKHGTEHDPRIALAYAAKIEALIGQPSFVQPQLFHWWNETEHNAR
jgi:hypothetical protein